MRVLIIRKIVANRNELYFSERFNSLINRTTQCTKLIYWQNIDKLKKVTKQCRQPQRVALQLTFYFVDILNSESTNLVIQRISMKQQQFYFFKMYIQYILSFFNVVFQWTFWLVIFPDLVKVGLLITPGSLQRVVIICGKSYCISTISNTVWDTAAENENIRVSENR